MTSAQAKKLYWPLWSKALRTAWFRDPAAGYVLQSAEPMAEQITLDAQARAHDECRALSQDDLRHAAHRLALGHDQSSKTLDNRDLDRLVSLFRILADPDDLRARLDWDHPERTARRRYDHVIRTSVPEAYARHVSADKFGQADPERLSHSQARDLAMTLRARAAARQPV